MDNIQKFEALGIKYDLFFQFEPSTYTYLVRNDKGKCIYKYYAEKDKLHRLADNAFFFGDDVARELEHYYHRRQVSRSSHDNVSEVATSVPGGSAVRQSFLEMVRNEQRINGDNAFHGSVLVAIVKLKTGAKETIVNHDCIEEKCNYYLNAYDENFRLKSCPDIQIVGIILA